MELKEWAIFKESCEHRYDKKGHGYYCKKTNKKCSFENCPFVKTPPIASHGNKNNLVCGMYKEGVDKLLTKKQQEVLRHRNEGKTLDQTSVLMGVSRQAVHKLERKALSKIGGLTKSKKNIKKGVDKKARGVDKKRVDKKHNISLHNDSVTFEAKCNLDEIPYETKELKYTNYKFYKDDKLVMKFFEKKLVVQFRDEIICKTTQEALQKATNRIKSFMQSFQMDGVKIDKNSLKQVSRHYAVLGTELAKRYVREGKKFLVLDEWDNKERLIIDFSDKDKKNGMPHFEAVHTDKSNDDITISERFFDDMINKPHYLPSETKGMLDIILSVQKEYAYQIKKHLEVQEETLKTLKEIQKNIRR